jgi:hypothetical protein
MLLLQLISIDDTYDFNMRTKLINKATLRLFQKFYNNKEFDFNVQQEVGGFLSEQLRIGEFSNLCENIFKEYKSVGILYSLTLALQENNISINRILDIINSWLEKNSLDASDKEKILFLKEHIIKFKKTQQLRILPK